MKQNNRHEQCAGCTYTWFDTCTIIAGMDPHVPYTLECIMQYTLGTEGNYISPTRILDGWLTKFTFSVSPAPMIN